MTHSAPQPYSPRRVSTRYVRVPAGDWLRVKRFEKTEFRLTGGYPGLVKVQVPTPVVLYATRDRQHYESTMAVLENVWSEPVGAITADSLEREGFETMAHFRRYWMGRTKGRFKPFQPVVVFRVRAYVEGDTTLLGTLLIERLYGEFLNGVR